ncbi:MAG: hypothetical protein A2144_05725 [Chloroflexi bacterium RBG_16_50_9]|nr:MAG: hypothetical protein A2144_05725 [Chloroflexi bacterium RBG_16_50_9]
MNRLIYSTAFILAGIIVFTGAISGCASQQTVTPIPPPVIEQTSTENQTTSIPTPEPTPIPAEVELKYDNGNDAGFMSSAGGGYLIDFMPSAMPLTITKIKLYAGCFGESGESKQFLLQIWDKDKKVLYENTIPVNKFQTGLDINNFQAGSRLLNWVNLEIPMLDMTDKFYVHIYAGSISFKGRGFLLGVDNTVVNEHSTITQQYPLGGEYTIRSDWPYRGGWGEDKNKVNWMIRVVGTVTQPLVSAGNQTPTITVIPTIIITPEPTPIPTENQTIPTPEIVINPVEEYAKSIDLPDDLARLLKPLGADSDMSETDRLAVDTAKEISKLNISDPAKKGNVVYLMYRPAEFSKAYSMLKAVSDNTSKDYLELGIGDNVIEYLSLLSSLTDRKFADYALKNMFCIQDRSPLTDLEKDFLKEPEKYRQQMLEYRLSQVGMKNGKMAGWLKELPDLKNPTIEDLKALEDEEGIARLVNLFGTNYDSIDKEGIPGKRKFNAAWQAIHWIYKDWEQKDLERERPFDKYLAYENARYFFRDVPLMRLVNFSWIESSTSKEDGYKKRWGNFDEVVNRMNAPALITQTSEYTGGNYVGVLPFKWDPTMNINVMPTPQQVFNSTTMNRRGISVFMAYSLRKNGYEAWILTRSAKVPSGLEADHLFKQDGLFYRGVGEGPYSTVKDAACKNFLLYGTCTEVPFNVYDVKWKKVPPETIEK